MEPGDILDLYVWTVGTCFRCARTREPVTQLAAIKTQSGQQYAVRACRGCVLLMEAERQRRAQRSGASYEPGKLGR